MELEIKADIRTEIEKDINMKIEIEVRLACQTGSPRAACGPITCPMRPTAIFLNYTIT